MNDQPQPEQIKKCLEASLKRDWQAAFAPILEIWKQGYSATDIISTFGKVAKQMDAPEHIKLEWLKEVGLTHMRASAGTQGLLQLDAMVSKLVLAAGRG
mmetsp:Transcript_39064/g.81707  ORF Transcript_39064/g.81707 Transcript_39064/m.81707 type:complete len:99 (+) Transcript_39064:1-297(+)